MLATSSLVLASLATAPAYAGNVLPSGGSVTSGSATISQPNSTTLNINQSTNQAIINWNSFSVGRGDTVNFIQPGASSATLNRVSGSTPSWIAGTINAPGTVLLVNPNGIAITKSGVVNTGSFAASTLDIKDSDFLSGHYTFKGSGASAGVINKGHINVSDGGFAALLGGQVSNNGVIAARLGFVAMGAGEMATLDLSGDGFLSVAVPSSQLGNLVNANGALVSNKGKILANGGTVYLSAATASNILRNAINSGGLIRANSVGMHNGQIVLNGGDGKVNVTGHITANGGRHHNGGNVQILGNQIKVRGVVSVNGQNGGDISIVGTGDVILTGSLLASGFTGQGGVIAMTGKTVSLVAATIDAWGATDGGAVDIGGGPHSTVQLADAQTVSMDTASTINADATDDGNGGHIVIWSDGLTTAKGTLSAKGGAHGGNGGLIETSGHSVDFTGIDINASAAHGAAGTWLIDPTNLTIDSAAAATIVNALDGGTSVTLQTNVDGTTSGPGTTSSGNGDIVFNSAILALSGSGNTTLNVDAFNNIVINANLVTLGSFSAQAGGTFTVGGDFAAYGTTRIATQGDITINDPFEVGNNLTITTAGNLTANYYIATLSGGASTFTTAITAAGSIQVNDGISTPGQTTINAGGNISVANNCICAGGPLTLRADYFGTGTGTVSFSNGGTVGGSAGISILYDPTSYSSPTDFSSHVNNGSLTAYMLVNNVSDLQAINNNLHGTYALGEDINANGANITPIGYSGPNSATAFTGLFDGENHLISNLAIATNNFYGGSNTGMPYGSGLFEINAGTIRNVGVGGSVNDLSNNVVGGLAAWNTGTISNSYSTMSVASGGASRFTLVGGLVGRNKGLIENGSYATGSIRAVGDDNVVGGLVGGNEGTVQNSYATGAVNGNTAGGLVGENFEGGIINNTYALGSVHGGEYTGGLVGQNDWSNVSGTGTIYNSYAAGALSGSYVGGLVGNNEYDNLGTFSNGESATVEYSLWNADTTGTTRPFGVSYYDIGGSSNNDSYIGFVSTNSSLTSPTGAANAGNPYQISSYWFFNDPQIGNSSMQSQAFNANWFMIPGYTMPFLNAEYSTTIQNTHQLQLMDLNPSATYTMARNITANTNDGMWTSAGFVPISSSLPVAYEYQVYARVGPGSGAYMVQSQISDDLVLVQTYVTSFIPVDSFSPWALQSQTFVNDGAFKNSPFVGTLNGNGYTISGLYENTNGNRNAGLFDTLGTYSGFGVTGPGTVENLGIVNSQFINWNPSGSANDSGTIAGINFGTITGSWAVSSTNSIGSPTVSGWGATGGLVGLNLGTISQSYAAVPVVGVNQNVGGTPAFNDIEGGLVGMNNGGTIVNSYATGNVAGNGTVGGLVGLNTGTIANTYATGQLFADWEFGVVRAGPLVGLNAGTVTNSYWNSDSWNGSFGVADPYYFSPATTNTSSGTGLTTAQMQNLNSYASMYWGWDFETIWAPPNQAGQGGVSAANYPQLYVMNDIVVLAAENATQQYGAASPAFAAGLYSLGDAGLLRSYSAGPLGSSGTSSSPVGSYSIGLQQPVRAADVGKTAPACGSTFCNFFMTINGWDIQLGGVSSISTVVAAINDYTSFNGVTASVDAGGHLVLTAARSINVSEDYANNDYFGIAGSYAYTPAGTYSASMLNGSTPRTLFLPGTLTITPAPLTITANSDTKTYGDTVVNGSTGYTVSGLVNNDSVYSVSFSSSGLAATATVDGGPYTITPSNAQGTGLSNYAITYVNGTLTIDPATLTYTANAANMTYGGVVPALGGTVTGFVNNETLAGATTGTLIWSTTATSSANVGSYAINGGGLTANHGDYTFVQAAGNATALTINPATLVVTPEAVLMTYGGVALDNQAYSDNAANYSITGYVNGQNATSAGLSFTGSMAFNGSTTTQVLNAGAYGQSQGTLAMSSAHNNYVMQFANPAPTGSSPNNYVITPASFTAISGTKTYDGSAIFTGNEVTLTGITVNGVAQTFMVSSATANSANASSNTTGTGGPASAFTSVGTIAGNNGADPNNYTLNLLTIGTNTATINTANYTAATGTKTYDGNATFSGTQMVLTGVAGQLFTGTATANSANASSNMTGVGGPATDFTGITSISSTNGADPNNYTLNIGGLTINQATINVAAYTAIAGTKIYDGNANFASGQVTLTGVNGEAFNVAATANSANASSNTSGIGGQATTFVSTSGSITGIGAADPNNYGALNVALLTGTNNEATINAANYTTLTGTKTYDGNTIFSGSQVVLNGVDGQLFTGTATANSANASSNTTGAGGPATDFTGIVSISSTNGADPNNYRLNLAGLTNNQATINVASYSAIAGTKTYDGNANFASGQITLSGVNGETFNIAATANSINASSNTTGVGGPATSFASTSGPITGIGAADPNNYSALNIASLTGTNNVATINVAAYTAIAGTKTYDGNANFDSNQVTLSGVNGETFNVAATANSANASSNSVDPATSFTGATGSITGIGAADPNNYGVLSVASLTGANNTATVTPATVRLTGSRIYDGTTVFAATAFGINGTTTIDTGVNGETLNVAGSGTVGSPNVDAGMQSLTLGTLALADGTGLAGNYQIASKGNTGTVTPGTLTYIADPSIQTFGVAFPTFTGTVTGFVSGETLASATTGAAQFTTPATPQSTPGTYGIYGSGLTANHGNYVFVQAASNATALTLNPAPTRPPNPPTTPTQPGNQVTINFTNNGGGVARVSFTPNGSTASNQGNDVSPSSLPPGEAFMHNHGLYFPPISQFDANQYSDFKLPPYDKDDSEATVLTIIARGIAQTEAGQYTIDGFWNGSEDTWPGATHVDLLGKGSFSDGAGHNVTPTNDSAFPIVAGKTDFAALLMNGPVMIGGPTGQTPPQWLLAVSMTPDGKGIICDDTQTGGLVELAYDPATKTLGGITAVFDAKTKGFIALADAGNDIPASDLSGLSGLQSFVPSTYYALTVR